MHIEPLRGFCKNYILYICSLEGYNVHNLGYNPWRERKLIEIKKQKSRLFPSLKNFEPDPINLEY
jgi:hypothetical protein